MLLDKPGNKWSVLDFIEIGMKGMPGAALGGIDVTYRCNLRCRHCYFLKQHYHEELLPRRIVNRGVAGKV